MICVFVGQNSEKWLMLAIHVQCMLTRMRYKNVLPFVTINWAGKHIKSSKYHSNATTSTAKLNLHCHSLPFKLSWSVAHFSVCVLLFFSALCSGSVLSASYRCPLPIAGYPAVSCALLWPPLSVGRLVSGFFAPYGHAFNYFLKTHLPRQKLAEKKHTTILSKNFTMISADSVVRVCARAPAMHGHVKIHFFN